MVADAALGRAARDIVLNPVAGENFDLSIVQFRGHGYFQHPLGHAQDLAKAWIELQIFGGDIELNLRNTVRI